MTLISHGSHIGLQISWAYVHRNTVRGDYALLFFTTAALILYAVNHSICDHALKSTVTLSAMYSVSLALTTIGYRLSPWHPLASYPGPPLWRVSSMVLTLVTWRGRRYIVLDRLHKEYGPFLRIGTGSPQRSLVPVH